MLRDKYGDNISGFHPVEGSRWPQFASGWWRELMRLEGSVGVNWFTNKVMRKVSNGRGTSFWKDRWIGDQPLAFTFPRIFSLSTQKEAKVRDLWDLHNGEASWNLSWRREPFLYENNLIENLLHLIGGVSLGEEVDNWIWLPEDGGVFSVCSSYRVLEEIMVLEGGLSVEEERAFVNLWRSLVDGYFESHSHSI